MNHRSISCVACGSDTTVDVGQDAHRCPSCGTKYSAPWDDPQVVSSPIPSDEWQGDGASVDTREDAATPERDGQAAVAVDGDGGIRVTIDVDVP